MKAKQGDASSNMLPFIYEGGFCVRAGSSKAFLEWSVNAVPKARAACPEGIRLIGIFVVKYSSEKDAGDYRILWTFDSFGAHDRLRESFAEKGPLREFGEGLKRFSDESNRWSQTFVATVESAERGAFFND